MSKPVAVLISDVHFTVPTLALASAALRAALAEAQRLNLPLVIAGDTLDSKAIMRGECVNALIEIFKEFSDVSIYVLTGNHDFINEKGKEHTLNFLKPYVYVIDAPTWIEDLSSWLVPYMSNGEELQSFLRTLADGHRIIMHQGVQTAYMGHYQQDKSSLPKEAFADFRVISGHYHRAQDIKCGRPRKGAVGLFSYIGNPYTLSFGEAEDGPKGFQILHDNGLLTQVPLDLRRHRILNLGRKGDSDSWNHPGKIPKDDILWVKLHASTLQLAKIDKKYIAEKFIGHSNFKLDKIPTDEAKLEASTEKLTGEQIFDMLIDGTDEQPAEKQALKSLWREVLE